MTNPDQYESPPPTTPQEIADEIRRLLGRVEAMACEMTAKPAPLSPAGFRDYIAKYHAMVSRHLDQLLATSTPNSPPVVTPTDLEKTEASSQKALYRLRRLTDMVSMNTQPYARDQQAKITHNLLDILESNIRYLLLASTPNSPPVAESVSS